MHKQSKVRKVVKALGFAVTLVGFGFAASAMADSTPHLSTVASSVDKTVGLLAQVLIDLALVAGVGFVMASFFKFHQHKLNPTQVPLSQGLTLMVIGAGLMLIPKLIPIAATSFLGDNAKVSQVGGKDIKQLIGANG